jgi:hypothetical protein
MRSENFCCTTMQNEILHGSGLLDYNQKLREYGVRDPKSFIVVIMQYCMFCGKKLPTSLRDLWFDILENEFGLMNPLGKDKKKIPGEFLSDQWWRERRL